MKCPNCKSELLDDALYCAQCGMKIERCKQCNNILQADAHYCSYCGTPVNNQKSDYQPINSEYTNRLGGYYQKSDEQISNEYTNRLGGYYKPLNETYKETVIKEETVNFNEINTDKKVNKKVIILSVIALVVSTALAGSYLLKTGGVNPFSPDNKVETSVLKISGDTDQYAYIGNINQGGHATLYKDRLYVCNDEGHLVSMSRLFDDRKTLTDYKVEYVQIIDDIIYFVNDKMQICTMDINGGNQSVIVNKEAYYVQVIGSKIYYQSDDEGERLHVFDLKTLEDKELNQRVTYEMNITDDKIYYSSTDGIYCIGINGMGEEKLSSDRGHSLILKDNKLYYSTTNYESKAIDLKTKTSEKIIDEKSSLLNMTSDYIFCYSVTGLNKYDVKTKECTDVYSGNINFVEVVGDVLIITDNSNHRIVMDFNGKNQQRLFLSNEQNFV